MDLIRQRLATAAALRTSILSTTTPAAAAATTATLSTATRHVAPSLKYKMLDYHNPDVSLLGLSNQDADLGTLELKDKWLESKLMREEDFIKRGKVVRVGVLSGRAPKVADDGKKKKKKK
ncbi:hypothetical protein BDR26DRAFT_1007355 [Obelidium mucronatum]|nr:hypothetical protein BDR26DRAFT_1007355 [Obelidium mucronatum]